jgi:hypothetical protein
MPLRALETSTISRMGALKGGEVLFDALESHHRPVRVCFATCEPVCCFMKLDVSFGFKVVVCPTLLHPHPELAKLEFQGKNADPWVNSKVGNGVSCFVFEFGGEGSSYDFPEAYTYSM